MTDALLSIRDLHVTFTMKTGRRLLAVRGIDLDIGVSELVAVVGESGSGKSVTMMAVLGLLGANATVTGSARFDGVELVGASPAALRRVRGKRIGTVFQDPLTSLNPAYTIGHQLAEAVLAHDPRAKRRAGDRAGELLEMVSISDVAGRLKAYPHELSGGLRQRVMIAMALANDPELLIADEPTTALDVTIQAQILDVLASIQQERHLAVVLVTHDLGVVAGLADRINVMYAGRIVECGDAVGVFHHQNHPYTRGLLACLPRLDRRIDLTPIGGAPPSLHRLPGGAPSIRGVPWRSIVATDMPELRTFPSTMAACHLAPLTPVPP